MNILFFTDIKFNSNFSGTDPYGAGALIYYAVNPIATSFNSFMPGRKENGPIFGVLSL